MRLSDGVEWGIHCAAVLAALPEGTALSAKDLAAFHGVSESYLLKHLKAMAKVGILGSLPGPAGGFRLAQPADQITILAILDAIEGTFTPFRCTEIRKRCPVAGPESEYSKPCHVHALMLEAQMAYRGVLRQTTLADIVEQVAKSVPPKRQAAAGEWLSKRARTRAAKEK